MVVLEVCDLSYAYADGTKALSDISFSVCKGEKLFFHGANGAGKTTLFQCIIGLLKVKSGTIKINGKAIKKESDRMKHIGLVFQNPNDQIIAGSVFDEVAFGPLNMGLSSGEALKRTEYAMSIMNLEHLRNKPPHFLSYGQKKRLAIASVLSMNNDIVILDEPTAGLDPQQAEQLTEALSRLTDDGITLLISTHDSEFSLKCADKMLVLDNGKKVCEGTPEQVFLNKHTEVKKPVIVEIYDYIVQRKLLSDAEILEQFPRDTAQLLKLLETITNKT